MAERLRALIESKEVLLRDLSHELRSPLARLRVATELARHQGTDLPNQLDRIERDTERLDELIGHMLQLSQLDSAEPVRTRARVDLTNLVSEIVEDARLEASVAAKAVVWSPGPGIWVEGDPELLCRAIENIIRNGVRFTPSHSSLEIALVAQGSFALLRVRDHGPGVPAGDLARIFEPFYRVSSARERDSGGTGLGLAITARVAAIHKGTVRAENCRDGGLVVELTIPMGSPLRTSSDEQP
jgi:two-component system sensor histidine kinase CpxA